MAWIDPETGLPFDVTALPAARHVIQAAHDNDPDWEWDTVSGSYVRRRQVLDQMAPPQDFRRAAFPGSAQFETPQHAARLAAADLAPAWARQDIIDNNWHQPNIVEQGLNKGLAGVGWLENKTRIPGVTPFIENTLRPAAERVWKASPAGSVIELERQGLKSVGVNLPDPVPLAAYMIPATGLDIGLTALPVVGKAPAAARAVGRATAGVIERNLGPEAYRASAERGVMTAGVGPGPRGRRTPAAEADALRARWLASAEGQRYTELKAAGGELGDIGRTPAQNKELRPLEQKFRESPLTPAERTAARMEDRLNATADRAQERADTAYEHVQTLELNDAPVAAVRAAEGKYAGLQKLADEAAAKLKPPEAPAGGGGTPPRPRGGGRASVTRGAGQQAERDALAEASASMFGRVTYYDPLTRTTEVRIATDGELQQVVNRALQPTPAGSVGRNLGPVVSTDPAVIDAVRQVRRSGVTPTAADAGFTADDIAEAVMTRGAGAGNVTFKGQGLIAGVDKARVSAAIEANGLDSFQLTVGRDGTVRVQSTATGHRIDPLATGAGPAAGPRGAAEPAPPATTPPLETGVPSPRPPSSPSRFGGAAGEPGHRPTWSTLNLPPRPPAPPEPPAPPPRFGGAAGEPGHIGGAAGAAGPQPVWSTPPPRPPVPPAPPEPPGALPPRPQYPFMPKPDTPVPTVGGTPVLDHPPPNMPADLNLFQRIMDVAAIPIALKASLTPPFMRQGWTRFVTAPRAATNELGMSLKNAFREADYAALNERIVTNPLVRSTKGLEGDAFAGKTWVDAGGTILESGPGSTLTTAPEELTVLSQGRVGRRIQRLYPFKVGEQQMALELNLHRTNWYESVAKNMIKAGDEDLSHYVDLRRKIEHFTQRGDVPQPGGVPAFFSTRAISGRVQGMWDIVSTAPGGLTGGYLRPGATQEAGKVLLGMTAAGGALIGVPAALGLGTIERSQYGLPILNVSGVRLDPWASWNPIVKGVGGLIADMEKLAEGGDWNNLPQDAMKVISADTWRFLKNGLSPSFSTWLASATGKDWLNHRYNLAENAKSGKLFADMFLPFIIQDVYEAYKKGGIGAAVATTPLSFLSGGVGSYTTTKEAYDNLLTALPDSQRPHTSDGQVIPSWEEMTNAQQTRLLREHPEFQKLQDKLSGESVQSNFDVTRENVTVARTAAWESFQKTGDGAAYRDSLTNAGLKASGAYDVLLKNQKDAPAKSADRQLVQDYFKELDAAGNDREERDRLDVKFRAGLPATKRAVLDDALITSPDPNYENLKKARDYIEKKYWSQRDDAYLTMRAAAPANSPLKNYSDYSAMVRAAEDRATPDAVAKKLKGKVDSALTGQTDVLRVNDPKLDAYLFIYGYRDSVTTPAAQAAVKAWSVAYNVSMAVPPLKKR
jgi:hypothetical protein